MAGTDDLRNMVMTFRVSELQMLLGFAGRNKSGRKTELQSRALELLRLKSTPVQMKIRDLYKSIQQGLSSGQPPGEPNTTQSQNSSSTNSNSNSSYNTNPMMNPNKQRSNMMNINSSNQPNYNQYQQGPRNNMYSGHMPPNSVAYHYQPQPGGPMPPVSGIYPVHPDVKLKSLPFYELRCELLKPSSLMPCGNSRIQEQSFVFHLTPQQASDIAMNRDMGPGSKSDYVIQVQMRFCLLETSCEQDDFFPPGIIVKLNNKLCPLPNPIPTNKPGVEPKRPPRPVNVTPLCKLSPTVGNHISISWATEYGRGYAVAVNLVKKLTSTQLLNKLKTKGVRHADFTTGLIKEKLSEDADNEIATTSLRVSLMCPLGKVRMSTPCRPTTCTHLQCFDASLYLQMNERKPTWMCPVCDKPGPFDKLAIDGYFQEVLQSGRLSADHSEIQLHQDGSWSTLAIKKEQHRVISPPPAKPAAPAVYLDCDEPEIIPIEGSEKIVSPKKKAIVVDLTLSDSDDDESTKTAVQVTSTTCTKTEGVIKSDHVKSKKKQLEREGCRLRSLSESSKPKRKKTVTTKIQTPWGLLETPLLLKYEPTYPLYREHSHPLEYERNYPVEYEPPLDYLPYSFQQQQHYRLRPYAEINQHMEPPFYPPLIQPPPFLDYLPPSFHP